MARHWNLEFNRAEFMVKIQCITHLPVGSLNITAVINQFDERHNRNETAQGCGEDTGRSQFCDAQSFCEAGK